MATENFSWARNEDLKLIPSTMVNVLTRISENLMRHFRLTCLTCVLLTKLIRWEAIDASTCVTNNGITGSKGNAVVIRPGIILLTYALVCSRICWTHWRKYISTQSQVRARIVLKSDIFSTNFCYEWNKETRKLIYTCCGVNADNFHCVVYWYREAEVVEDRAKRPNIRKI